MVGCGVCERAEDAVDLALPSIPGYGFVLEAWIGRIARAETVIAHALGNNR